MTLSRSLLCLAACATLLAALAQARAEPLDDDTCTRAKDEYKRLQAAGVDRDMAKGPAWAKANLAPERLALVRRFIELEEMRLFRCRDISLVAVTDRRKLAAVDRPTELTGDKQRKSKPAAGRASAARSKGARAPAARRPHAKAAAGQPSQWGVISIERSSPRAKVDDDYSPPPFNPAAIAEKLGLPPQQPE